MKHDTEKTIGWILTDVVYDQMLELYSTINNMDISDSVKGEMIAKHNRALKQYCVDRVNYQKELLVIAKHMPENMRFSEDAINIMENNYHRYKNCLEVLSMGVSSYE